MESWRGVIAGLLYGLIFTGELDDSVVAEQARRLISDQWGITAEEAYAQLATALVDVERHGAQLTEFFKEHSESAVREFLGRLVDQMHAMRPWPELPYRRLELVEWPRFRVNRAVAGVLPQGSAAHNWLEGFSRNTPGSGRKVLLLRLRSGAEVALAGDWWSGRSEFALLPGDPSAPPVRLVDELVVETPLERRDFTMLDGDRLRRRREG